MLHAGRAFAALGWLLVGALFAAPVPRAEAQGQPIVERIEPSSGPAGTLLRISGLRFAEPSKVRIGDTELPIEKLGPTLITARVSERAATGWVYVETLAGKVRGPEFVVTAKPEAPVIESVEPMRAAPGSEVFIRGQHFSPRAADNAVLFGDASAVIRSVSPIELRVTVPMNASSGPLRVIVARAGEAQSPKEFAVLVATAIHELSPRLAPAGSKLTITGTGFAPEPKRNRVYLNNTELDVLEASETKLVVTLPRDAISGALLVDVKGGGRATFREDFQVQRPPSIVGFSPSSAQPTARITVRGTGFGIDAAAIEARIGDAPAKVLEADKTQLVLEVPPAAVSGKLSIRVNGVGPVWADKNVEVLPPLAIKGFAPRSGPVGISLIVEGTGFATEAKDNRVRVGGADAEVIAATGTRLSIRVPATQSGLVTVEQPSGARAASMQAFVVTRPPQITLVTLGNGTIGSEITISGSGFGSSVALLEVRLGTQLLQVRSVRDDAIVAVLPSAPTKGALSVKVAQQGSAKSDQVFDVVAP